MNARRFTLLSLSAVALCALSFTTPRASDPTPEQAAVPTGYDEARDPARDLDAAEAKALAGKKRVLLFVGGDWCGWCHQMATFFASNDDLREMLRDDFEVVKVAVDRAGKGHPEFFGQFPPLTSFPIILVLEPDRSLVCIMPGADMADYDKGTYDRDKMCGFLSRWEKGHARTGSGERGASGTVKSEKLKVRN